MRLCWRRTASCRSGTAAIEMALIAPVFFAFLFGMLDVGWFFASQMMLDWATTKGARYAAVNSSSATASSIASLVKQDATPIISSCTTTCNVSVSFSPANQVGGTVTITSTYSWSPLSTVTGPLAQTLTSTITMPIVN